MTEQAKLYSILKNTNNERCIMLTPKTPYEKEIASPEIIYACGEHAILYRSTNDAIILDYYPKTEQEILKTAHEILVVEYDLATNTPTREYMAKVTIVKSLPDITKHLTISQNTTQKK